MNLIYPKIPLKCWPAMLGVAGLGALIAGCYGIIHDQLTYTISAEYFTQMKFRQFAYADFGFPARVLVGEIGFLATWWVGFFAGWVLARVVAPHVPPSRMLALSLRGFAIIIIFALLGSVGTFACGLTQNPTPETSALADFAASIGVADVPAFVRVAWIHNTSYLAGLFGIITAAFAVRRSALAQACSDV